MASTMPRGQNRDDDRVREDALLLLRAQLAANAATVVSSIAGNVVNAACASAVMLSYRLIDPLVVVTNCVLLAIILGARWRSARAIARIDTSATADTADRDRLRSLHRQVTIQATLLGLFWGIVACAMLVTRDPDVGIFAGIIGAGMMSAGVITYRTLPVAAQGYLLTCAIGALAGLVSLDTRAGYAAVGLLACYVVVLRQNLNANAQRFAEGEQRQRALTRSSDTIQLLLNDVTEQGSDWLIEVDRTGCLIDPCARLAEAASRPIETLGGLPFSRLLDEGDARDAIKREFAAGRAIRRQIVSLTVAGEQRWWSVSARPGGAGRVAYRGVVTDITAQRQAEDKVSYLAHYDGLTDLPNRFLFHDRLHHALGRGSGAVGVMYLDLDQFKAVNDTLGHSYGDKLLQTVASRLTAIAGRSAMVARLGGDEFAILVSRRRLAGIDRLARRIVAELAQPLSLGDHDVITGVSIGIAIAPQDGATPELLLRKADLALYAAKAQGRGLALHFAPEMDEVAQVRRAIEMDLRGALARDELRLHYQPMINSVSGDVTGYEALLRWEHPARGMVMPDVFVPVAEECGLIVPLGEWVIRQALDDARRWPDHVGIAINLSPLQMRSPMLISTIVGALAASAIVPSRVCFEITESVLMQDSDANIQTLHKLRGFGIHIALDDFGTGYSSLNYLRSFPFSKIKIDRCFTADIDSRADCQAIVKSIVDLAASLGMSVIAEGVERPEQVTALLAQGCREVQGFLYQEALAVGELGHGRSDDAAIRRAG